MGTAKRVGHMYMKLLNANIKIDEERKQARLLRLKKESLNPFFKLRGMKHR